MHIHIMNKIILHSIKQICTLKSCPLGPPAFTMVIRTSSLHSTIFCLTARRPILTHTHTATNKQTCTCVPTSIYYTTIPLHIIRMQTYHSQQVPSMSMPMRPCSNMSSGPSITSIKGPGQVCTCCTLVPQTASVCYNMKYMCMHTGMHLHTAHYHKYVYTIALHIALQQARHMLNIYIYI